MPVMASHCFNFLSSVPLAVWLIVLNPCVSLGSELNVSRVDVSEFVAPVRCRAVWHVDSGLLRGVRSGGRAESRTAGDGAGSDFFDLTVAVLILVLAPLTQACFNPARDFGPRRFTSLAGWVATPCQARTVGGG